MLLLGGGAENGTAEKTNLIAFCSLWLEDLSVAGFGEGLFSIMNWSVRLEKQLEPLEKIEIDHSWLRLLPPGCDITSTRGHVASFWTRSARINVRLTTGEEKAFLLKLATGDAGKEMVKGELESMRALYQLSPNFVPRPIGCGTYESAPDNHFFLCDFVDMADELPDVVDFCEKLADLHRRSIALGPEGHKGEFGFHVTTYNGRLPQDNTWNESWEAFYIRGIKHMFALEESVHGPSPEIQSLLPALYEKVIPRLLRPLETEGRILKPCLVHGDLWDCNVAVHVETDQPFIFDSSAFWAHNEYDLAMWRPHRFKMRKTYIREYFKHFPISAPEEDWDDRNLLYSIRTDLHDSALYALTTRFRDLIIASMRQLIEKYPRGYEGTALRKGHGNDVPIAQPVVSSSLQRTSPSLTIRSGSITPLSPSPGNAFLSPIGQTVADLTSGEPTIGPAHEPAEASSAGANKQSNLNDGNTTDDRGPEEAVARSSHTEPMADIDASI